VGPVLDRGRPSVACNRLVTACYEGCGAERTTLGLLLDYLATGAAGFATVKAVASSGRRSRSTSRPSRSFCVTWSLRRRGACGAST
jgi:hypothetical protein